MPGAPRKNAGSSHKAGQSPALQADGGQGVRTICGGGGLSMARAEAQFWAALRFRGPEGPLPRTKSPGLPPKL